MIESSSSTTVTGYPESSLSLLTRTTPSTGSSPSNTSDLQIYSSERSFLTFPSPIPSRMATSASLNFPSSANTSSIPYITAKATETPLWTNGSSYEPLAPATLATTNDSFVQLRTSQGSASVSSTSEQDVYFPIHSQTTRSPTASIPVFLAPAMSEISAAMASTKPPPTPSLTTSSGDASTIFSLLPSEGLVVQLVSHVETDGSPESVSVVVVTETSYRMEEVTITIFHTTSVSGQVTTIAETTAIAIATQALETYVFIPSAEEANPSDALSVATSAEFGDSLAPQVTSSAIELVGPYATISGFKIVPSTSSMTIQFLGTSPVTAILASQSPITSPNESFVPLWVPEMLGNAYGGGATINPPIWVLTSPLSSIDVRGAVVRGSMGVSEFEVLTDPVDSASQTSGGIQFFTLTPGASYAFPIDMPPTLEPIPVIWSGKESASVSTIATPIQPSVASPVRNLSSIPHLIPLTPPTSFRAFGGRASIGWFMSIFSILATVVLI